MKLGVDIGGTKTLVACFDEAGGIAQQIKFPTPPKYAEFLDLLAHTVVELSPSSFTEAVVAAPGKIDRRLGLGIAFGSLSWQNVPLRSDIQTCLGCPVMLENDAKLAGLSEALLVIKDFRKVLYITISTGIGSAVIVDGKIDPDLADSEAGQLLLEHQGRLVDWEDFASGSAIVKKFGKKASDITDPQVWYAIARNIAIGLVDLIAILTPEVIILGGAVAVHFSKFESQLQEELRIYENPLFTIPPIRRAVRPEEAVIYGCYELMKNKG